MSAQATDEQTLCTGATDFSVTVNQATQVMVVLNCKMPPRFGAVRADGKINICAELTKMVVSPLQTSVGSNIDLSAAGEDAEGDDLEFLWTAEGGEIADDSAAHDDLHVPRRGRRFRRRDGLRRWLRLLRLGHLESHSDLRERRRGHRRRWRRWWRRRGRPGHEPDLNPTPLVDDGGLPFARERLRQHPQLHQGPRRPLRQGRRDSKLPTERACPRCRLRRRARRSRPQSRRALVRCDHPRPRSGRASLWLEQRLHRVLR